ncbi:MAG: hypothetical protein JNL05_07955 [Flavobacteriales bacterium]|nr:hypothetical protein [Flavobacteriales bacterium]
MRTRTILFALLAPCLIQQVAAQHVLSTATNALGQEVTTVMPTGFQRTAPMRTWPVVQEDPDMPMEKRREVRNVMTRNTPVNPDALPNGLDPALQQAMATRGQRAPIENWAGQSGSGYPPDPSGSAGPNHYVQAVNTAYRVYSKTGSSLGGPYNLSSLWPGSTNEGDPIVLYDRHADRWFISQFQFQPNRILIAISETPDPLGAYYAYSYTFSQFPDYPKYSVWWDGYYMTSNSNKTAVVFDRAKMLAGDASAAMVALTAPGAANTGFRCVMPADADGDLPPAGTPCYFFNLEDDAWSGVSQDRIKVYEMSVDWTTTSNTTITTSQTIATAPFDTNFGTGYNNIAQPGTTQKLDGIPDVFYFRAQHMRWVGYNTVMLCHLTDVDGSNRAGIRWYELRDANDGNWTIHQQGTWSPDAASRWLASIAMDSYGNIGLAYSYTDAANNLFPGLRYTGRYAGDPLGQMTVPETVAQTGGAAQQGINRYGDYAHMSLDPNGSTFWFTGEYLSTSGQPRTRIFSFDLQTAVGVDEAPAADATRLSTGLNGDQLTVELTGAPAGEALQLDLIAIDGRTLRSEAVRATNGTWRSTLDLSGLAPAAYFVRVGNSSFQRAQRFVLAR